MKKEPTVFVDIKSQYESTNPLVDAFGLLVLAISAELTKQLVTADEVEADFAITNVADTALRMVKESEKTLVVLLTFTETDRTAAVALAGRFPQRILTRPYIMSSNEEENILQFFQRIVSEKMVEAQS